MSYFVIHSGESGISIESVSESVLLQRITPNGEDYTYYGYGVTFLDKLPSMSDGYFERVPDNNVLIIKGNIIVPKEKTVVTSYVL